MNRKTYSEQKPPLRGHPDERPTPPEKPHVDENLHMKILFFDP